MMNFWNTTMKVETALDLPTGRIFHAIQFEDEDGSLSPVIPMEQAVQPQLVIDAAGYLLTKGDESVLTTQAALMKKAQDLGWMGAGGNIYLAR